MERTGTSTIEYDYALLAPGLARVAIPSVVSLEPLVGGRNSRVYRLDCAGGAAYVAKIYPEHRGGFETDRRAREYMALRFLWQRGIRCIPEAISTDPEGGYSIFRYVEGFPISGEGVVGGDIDFLVDFLCHLDGLKREPAARALGEASEACLSLEANFDHLRRRLGILRLAADPAASPAHAELRAFVEEEIEPAFELAVEQAIAGTAALGMAIDQPLREMTATLSPSDFGFHNARRRVDGSLVFLDFEHFGWDDPAKMVSDFLLHPGFALEPELRVRFFEQIGRRHACGADLTRRVPVVLPLFALKWTTILLNEFVFEHRTRRDHADPLLGPDEARLERQLQKAREMLATAKHALDGFPFASRQTNPATTAHCSVTSPAKGI